jgi:hippurate hydrolase
MKYISIALPLLGLLSCAATAQNVDALVADQLPRLVTTYEDIHEHPELSHHEERTSAKLAQELRKAGVSVTERVGKYPDGTQAYGVIGILQNGPGRKVLIRGDMDALPIVEETGAAYASQVSGVMHACGHDIHTTALVGVANVLAATRNRWHGTVMLIGQPSEETIDGAKAMLADDLYQRFGTPDVALAMHDTNTQAAGTVGVVSGPVLASSTSIDVTMRGIGGHGAAPQETKDPITMAGEFIVQLQTIVSREEDPSQPSVVSIGDIQGGAKRNIIPNEVKMGLTSRAYSDNSRQIVIDGVRRIAAGVALAAGVPEDRFPIVTVIDTESTPVTYNDPATAARVKSAVIAALGAANVYDAKPVMASDDFGVFGLEGHKIPTVMFWLGAVDAGKLAAANAAGGSLPGPHTSKWLPIRDETLTTGVKAMSAAIIAVLR